MISYRNKMLFISYTEQPSENCDYDSAYFRFIFALKDPETKRQYPKKLEVFPDYLKLQGTTIEEKANTNTIATSNSYMDNLIRYREPLYYCKEHPKFQNINLELIEHHLLYHTDHKREDLVEI
jgi:hypothetical protein